MRELKTWVFGDVHGAFRALKQIFERAPIQEGDTIISLGDIADGWSEVYECVELLLSMREKYNMIFIKGNHDDWTLTMMTTGAHPGLPQGGRATLDSYLKHGNNHLVIPDSHLAFFQYQHLYYKDDDKRLYVHGGFNRHILLKEHHDPFVFFWDRDLWHTALSYEAMQKGLVLDQDEQDDILEKNEGNRVKFKIKEPVSDVFIGHTTTGMWKKDTPMHAGPVWNLDTGAGFEGKLTIMNAETKEYWQSDNVKTLYPDEAGRRH